MGKLIDETGNVYSSLTVISRAENSKDGKPRWLCRCECLKETIVWAKDLRGGYTSSCGCRKSERISASKTTHGLSKTRAFKAYGHMIERCTNPDNIGWRNYGGRGITICDRWLIGVENFVEDMGEPEKGMSLDRIDNDLGYSPENCKWASRTEQNRNKRTNRLITFQGETRILAEWSEITGLLPEAIAQRLDRGWPLELALTAPPKTRLADLPT
jgi:hypothetical protein